MKRIASIFVMLCIAATLFVATPPNTAMAVSSWPVEMPNSRIGPVVAHGDDNVTLQNCNLIAGKPIVSQYRHSRVQLSKPHFTGSAGNGCLSDISYAHGVAMSDGTVYKKYATGDRRYLTAERHGREIWRTEVTHPNDCASWDSGKQSGDIAINSLSVGPDGKLYALLVPLSYEGQPNCHERLVAINRSNGNIEKDYPMSVGPAPGTGVMGVPSRLWTYSDRMLLVDRDGYIRTLDYNGVENEALRYKFPVVTSLNYIRVMTADQHGNVFAAQESKQGLGYFPPLLYKLSGGKAGSVPNNSYSNYLQPDGQGGAEQIDGNTGKIHRFNTQTDTQTVYQPIAPTVAGYTSPRFEAYARDTQGNVLVSWSYSNGDNVAYRVALHDANGGPTVIASGGKEIGNISTSSLYLMPAFVMGVGIADGYLYASSCKDLSLNDCWSNSAATASIQKIALPGFGAPIFEKTGYAGYVDTRQQYVAMGDSFSSGEGVEPFLLGSNIAGGNQCHRSEDAYPMLLERDTSLNLNMTAFVACSGATTHNVLYGGQYGEPAQVDALTEDTDVVTLTIGGNDVGFSEVLNQCAHNLNNSVGWACHQSTDLKDSLLERLGALERDSRNPSAYNPSGEYIIGLRWLIAEILERAPQADIILLGYPRMFGEILEDFEGNPDAGGYGYATCNFWVSGSGFGTTVSFSYDSAQWLNAQADRLNAILLDAANDMTNTTNKVQYVAPDFEGKRHCDGGQPGLYGLSVYSLNPPETNPRSFHPNQDGINSGYVEEIRGSAGSLLN